MYSFIKHAHSTHLHCMSRHNTGEMCVTSCECQPLHHPQDHDPQQFDAAPIRHHRTLKFK